MNYAWRSGSACGNIKIKIYKLILKDDWVITHYCTTWHEITPVQCVTSLQVWHLSSVLDICDLAQYWALLHLFGRQPRQCPWGKGKLCDMLTRTHRHNAHAATYSILSSHFHYEAGLQKHSLVHSDSISSLWNTLDRWKRLSSKLSWIKPRPRQTGHGSAGLISYTTNGTPFKILTVNLFVDYVFKNNSMHLHEITCA